MKVRIDQRFCGPPDSANGGYAAGLLAKALGGSDVEVTLRAPPPLGTDLSLEVEAGSARLVDGETWIGTAVRHPIEIDVPAPPPLAGALAAEERFSGFDHHIFPGCFVCGPDRVEGEGLRIFPGRIEGGVAATWSPAADLGDREGVAVEYLWSALDCPGYFAVREEAGLALLGRMGAVLHRRPTIGERLIVTGWPIARDGRKHCVGTALHDEAGALVAAAVATWISLKT